MRFTSDYTVPGSGFGRFLDKVIIQKEVEKTTVESLKTLKKLIEGSQNSKGAGPEEKS